VRRSPDIKPQEVNPPQTEQGFSNEVSPDPTYHATLSDEDKAEYAKFFSDPKKPPSAEMLRQWVHQKTGAYMTNADEIVSRFAQDGKFSTNQHVVIPTKHQSPNAAYVNHTANAAGGRLGSGDCRSARRSRLGRQRQAERLELGREFRQPGEPERGPGARAA
jgi:hypothetical protein